MKKFFYLAAIALSVCLVSCSDDDDNGGGDIDNTRYLDNVKAVNSIDPNNGQMASFTYENKKVKAIRVSTFNGSAVTTDNTLEFTYENDQLIKISKRNGQSNLIEEQSFAYNNSTITVTSNETTRTLTLNDKGLLVKNIREYIVLEGGRYDEELEEVVEQDEIQYKEESTYSYDTNGNLTEVVTKTYRENEEVRNTPFSYKYDNKNSFISKDLLPAWYIAYEGNKIMNGLVIGITNNCTEYSTVNNMPPYTTVVVKFDSAYDSESYPTELASYEERYGKPNSPTHFFTYK